MKQITMDFETYESELAAARGKGFDEGYDHGIDTIIDTIKDLLSNSKDLTWMDGSDPKDYLIADKLIDAFKGKTKKQIKHPFKD